MRGRGFFVRRAWIGSWIRSGGIAGCCLASWCMGGGASVAADWNRFRGPNGTGVASDTTPVPVEWSSSKNLKWKLPLPGAGVSCPIVVGDRVFVTCYSGYGVSRDAGDPQKLMRHVLCVEKHTGQVLWERTLPSSATEDPYSGMGVPQHGYASHTPVADAERVYVFLGKSGVVAFDLHGNQLWHTSVGTDSDPRRWGSSSSPILCDSILVVPAGAESRAIVGLDKLTGKELWRSDADSLGMVWGTPALVEAQGKKEIVIGAPYEVWALNPENGKLRWYCAATEDDQFSSSVVVADQTVFAVGGRGGGSVAVKAGGKDDVAQSHVVWKGRDSSQFATPIVHAGRMFIISGRIVTCLDAESGKEIFKSRLAASGGSPAAEGASGGARESARGGARGNDRGRGGAGGFGGSDYASPVIADGKIYFQTRSGEMHVMAVADEYQPLAVNRVTEDQEEFSATPAISDGAIYIRSNKHLYCVAN